MGMLGRLWGEGEFNWTSVLAQADAYAAREQVYAVVPIVEGEDRDIAVRARQIRTSLIKHKQLSFFVWAS